MWPKTKKCAKCGITSVEDPFLTFHKFPRASERGSLRVRVWAKFCFPDDDWTSDESLKTLRNRYRICGKHFDDSAYMNNDRSRMNAFAIPTDAQHILCELRDEAHTSTGIEKIEYPETSSGYGASTSQFARNVDITKKKGVLRDLDAKDCSEFTPRKKKLYKRCRRNLSEIYRLRQKIQNIKKCKRSILDNLTSNDFLNTMIHDKISSSMCLLLQSQMRNMDRKLPGRRWTLEDKVLALSIYKKSPSCYRLLNRLFCLPSISSLKTILNKIPMVCGLNDQVLETIRAIVKDRDMVENLCVLAFDEMSIRKNLNYNSKMDQIDGYQDHGGQGRTLQIANHALTFMAIGVRKNWKQPIAFYFSGDCVTADRLTVLIKEVLSACFSVGLDVLGIICDLDGVNIRAINLLGSTIDRPYFDHEGHEIITILDPPHLLKCFRNNFMKYNIKFTHDVRINENSSHGIAKWNHIKEFYMKDKENPNFVFAPAVTKQHLDPNGRQKMKVRLAAQVLSHSVAAGIFAKVGQNELSQEAIGTATVISNMDKLFDCMNGNTADKKRGKMYLTNMSSTSPHIEFFIKMKLFFRDMEFLQAKNRPPSLDGWLRTLNAVERFFYNLKKYNIHTLSVRRLNQDPLENCFGCIRSYCGCNANPTSVQFIAALKTSIVTNLINNNKNRNCLDDKNDILNNFKIFLSQKLPPTSSMVRTLDEFEQNVEYTFTNIDIPQCSGEMQACAYVCGYIANKMAISCNKCKHIILTDPNTEVFHLFTTFKEYDDIKTSLKYIQHNFCKMVETAATIINNYLKEKSYEKNIKCNLIRICENMDRDWLKGCEDHFELNNRTIINSTIAICLKRFCRLKNQEFTEEASKKSFKRKIAILQNV